MPVSISMSKQPRHHQSIAFPYPFFYKISGARYSGVPHKDIASLSF